MNRAASFASIALAGATALSAQSIPDKRSDSAPAVRFVAVETKAKLEVLDWGGTGRPLVLLAGLGNTAHVFDDLAHDLRANYHVYGITRRGFGRSTLADDGYTADRLGDDVLAVMDSLRLRKPALIGHSIAGEELSSIGSRHGDRVSALIYLDAANPYAFYDTTAGSLLIDLSNLERKLSALRSAPSRQLVDELLGTVLPTFERDLRELRAIDPADGPTPAPMPSADYQDRATFAAFRAWLMRSGGFAVPIAELRERFEAGIDGSVGAPLRSVEDTRWVSQSIVAGQQKYLTVSAPVLAIFAHPRNFGTFASPAAEANYIARDSSMRAEQAAVVRRAVPNARIVDLPGALHYVFLTNQADVVREINGFLKSLPN